MGDVIDIRTREKVESIRTYSPVDELITQLTMLRDEIGVALIVFRYKDGVDDWMETDILPDTRIALATFLLSESTKNIATYLMLDEETDDPEPA